MSLERRVRDALEEQADRVEVELHRVRELTDDKLAVPRRRRVGPLLVATAAAAAVAAVAGGVTVMSRSGGPTPQRPPAALGPHQPVAGGVATQFTCPNRSTVRFGPGSTNLSFVPSVEHGPRWFAARMQAPRYAFQTQGGTATLRLGNSDGSLGSVSTFTRTADGRWDVTRATKCVNGPYLADNPGRTGTFSVAPSFAMTSAREGARGCGTPTFLDVHDYYDAAGLLRHEWTFAARCPGQQARLTMVNPGAGSVTVTLLSWAGLRPADVGHLLPAVVDGKRGQVGLWALFDAHHRVADLSVQLRDGRTMGAETVDLRKHSGTVFLVLAPRSEVTRLMVQPVHGATRTYSSADPPGFRR